MYWCFLLRCVPGMALMGRSDSVLVFLAAECTWDGVDAGGRISVLVFLAGVCTWDGVDGEVGQCIGVSCWGVYLGWR